MREDSTRRPPGCARLAGLLFWLAAGPACAHGGLGDGQSIWSGALHLLTSPLALAALVGLTAVAFGCREKAVLPLAALTGLAAAAAAAAGARLPAPWVALATPLVAVLLGLVASSGRAFPEPGAAMLAVLAGLAAGLAADLDQPGWAGVIGVAGGVTLLLSCALAASLDLARLPRLAPLLPIARRVLGAWVAAIGLLIGALVLHLQQRG